MVWKDWVGKRVYIVSKNNKHPFIGRIVEVDDKSSNQLVWITLIDKYYKRMMFVHTEIVEIKEQREEDERKK